MLSHAAARAIISGEWRPEFGPETPNALRMAQSVGLIESAYGSARFSDCEDLKNWGAVQAGHTPCGPDACEARDTHPNPDGTSTSYQICFRRYSSDAEAVAHMLRVLMRGPAIAAAQTGDARRFAAAMYENGYFEGVGRTVADRIEWQAKRLASADQTIARALGEERAKQSSSTGGGGLIVFGLALGLGWALTRGGK